MKLGIYANIQKDRVREILPAFCDWAKNQPLQLITSQPLSELLGPGYAAVIRTVSEIQLIEESEMILVMGGDGTMLAAARLIGGSLTPLLGVNLGGLGFLAEISVENLYRRMALILAGSFSIQKRMVLSVQCKSACQTMQLRALNDVVVHRGGTSRLVKMDVHVNQQYFNTYHADGLIIATPTGSTAYSLSAGGPILIPEMEAIILNPICPHTLTARPAVLPGDHQVRVQVRPTDQPALLTIDGQVNVSLDAHTEIVIGKADYEIHSVSFSDSGFFDVLRKKLQWGAMPGK